MSPAMETRLTTRAAGLFRLLATLAVVAAAAGFARPAAAAGTKSFSLVSLRSHAVVGTDGSMTVTEEITYSFRGGPFTIGTRSFIAADRSRISGFSAAEDGEALRVDPPASTPTGEWEWHFASPVSDEHRTFTLSYTVDHAVQLGSDVGELYWQFLGKGNSIGPVEVTIDIPGDPPRAAEDSPDSDASVLRAWAHGPVNGTVTLLPGEVVLHVGRVPADMFVEARLAIPAAVFDETVARGDARLPKILAEEGGFIDAMSADKGRGYVGPPPLAVQLFGPIGAGLGLVGMTGLWWRFGREPKPDPMIGDYWREPLDDPPAVVLTNLHKGTVPLADAIGSTIIDLAQRGYLTIREERIERFGPDKNVVHLTRTPQAPAGLAGFERHLLDYVFRDSPETTTEEFTTRARREQSAAVAFSKQFQAGISAEFKARGYLVSGFAGGGLWIAGLGLLVVGLGALGIVLRSPLGWVGVVAGVVLSGATMTLLRNRSQRGADEKARAEALKRYLVDFSNLAEAPAGHLILWERFLVFAVAFGVAAKLLSGLAARLPQVIDDPSYGVWYASAGQRRFDSIDRIPASFGRAAASAISPSKSGSGGGFSGGGGGGGGGGGFGAR